ncbi:MAG: hypothetical protein PWQ57_3316 [Desulfovibrionales bacterium]|nr:hypothetical protein [Desulfovibrionales bacterium]
MAFPVKTGVPSHAGTYTPEIWSGKLLVKFYTATVLAQIANTDYEGEIKAHGDTVHIRIVPDINIKDYVVGQDLVYETPAPDEIKLLINKGKYYGFKVSDVQKFQSDIAYLERWSDDAGMQLKARVDKDVLADIYDDVDPKNEGATAGKVEGSIDLGSVGSPVAMSKVNVVDKIVQCGQVLDEQDVPGDNRWMVLPAWACTRIKTSDLKDASMTGDGKSILRNGRIGMIDRFTLYSSNQVASVTDGADTVFNCPFGHKSALTFASQFIENEMIDNPNDFGKLVRGLQVYGYKVAKPLAMGNLYAKAA